MTAEGWILAGRVGKPHGLDGSFRVEMPEPRLLAVGDSVTLADVEREIVRRSGTDGRPILRVKGVARREAIAALRGSELLVAGVRAPELGEDEWWASELEGCTVVDGDEPVGVVKALRPLPSCEVLVVERDGEELLVPLVRDAVRHVDVAARRIDVDLVFLGLES